MDNTSDTTEKMIISTARMLFVNNGYNGTTMQMIAEKANTNKALIHYYYRTKQQLFEKIFSEIAYEFIQAIASIFEKQLPLSEFLTLLIDKLTFYNSQHSDDIYFLFTELKRDNSLGLVFEKKLSEMLGKGLLRFYRQVNEAVENRTIRQISPQELLKIIFSLVFSGTIMKDFYSTLFGKESTNTTIKTATILKIAST